MRTEEKKENTERNCSECHNNAYYIGVDRYHTVFLSGRVNRPIVGHPLIHVDELGYKARYFAFHDRAVSSDYVLILGLGDVELRNDCRRGQCVNSLRRDEKFTIFFDNLIIYICFSLHDDRINSYHFIYEIKI